MLALILEPLTLSQYQFQGYKGLETLKNKFEECFYKLSFATTKNYCMDMISLKTI